MPFTPAPQQATPVARIMLGGHPHPYLAGNTVTLTATFLDADGRVLTPGTVVCRVKDGNGELAATYEQPDATDGVYTVSQRLPTHGHWRYRFEASSPGVPDAAEEATFFVRASAFS